MRRMPSAVSSIALTMRLGFVVFAISDLLQLPLVYSKRDVPLIFRQPQRPDLAPCQQLVGADVVALVLRERVKKHGAGTSPVGNDRAVAAGSPLSAACDPLLDQAAA